MNRINHHWAVVWGNRGVLCSREFLYMRGAIFHCMKYRTYFCPLFRNWNNNVVVGMHCKGILKSSSMRLQSLSLPQFHSTYHRFKHLAWCCFHVVGCNDEANYCRNPNSSTFVIAENFANRGWQQAAVIGIYRPNSPLLEASWSRFLTGLQLTPNLFLGAWASAQRSCMSSIAIAQLLLTRRPTIP